MTDIPSILVLALLLAANVWSYRKGILPRQITLGGTFLGWSLSTIWPMLWGSESRLQSLWASVSGSFIALISAWILLELGKLLFGRDTYHFEPFRSWGVSQPDEKQPPVFNLDNQTYRWQDLFCRSSDCLTIDCLTLNANGEMFENVKASLKMDGFKVCKGKTILMEQTLGNFSPLAGMTNSLVMPREVMGFGVVLLTAMTGAFIGARTAVYMLCVTLLFSLIVGLLHKSRTGCSVTPRISAAPFMIFSCVVFVVLRHFSVVL